MVDGCFGDDGIAERRWSERVRVADRNRTKHFLGRARNDEPNGVARHRKLHRARERHLRLRLKRSEALLLQAGFGKLSLVAAQRSTRLGFSFVKPRIASAYR